MQCVQDIMGSLAKCTNMDECLGFYLSFVKFLSYIRSACLIWFMNFHTLSKELTRLTHLCTHIIVYWYQIYIYILHSPFLAGFHELISNVLTCSVGMLKVKHTLRDTYVSITPLSCRIFKYCYVITYCNEKCCRIFIFDACLSLQLVIDEDSKWDGCQHDWVSC